MALTDNTLQQLLGRNAFVQACTIQRLTDGNFLFKKHIPNTAAETTLLPAHFLVQHHHKPICQI
jgi:hypothetical protein